MARARPLRAARLGAAASAVGFVVVAASCASPTQIVVEVFTDACPGSGKTEVVTSTGIAVGTAANIATQRPASTHVGCESATGVGTLTIYPSGANDEEVALKVLGGVEVAPDRCDPPGYAGCIVSQRTMRFVPHTTQRVTVFLSLACLNRECPDGKTCDNGACIDPQAILADGGTTDDAERSEAGAVDATAVIDASVQPDALAVCAGCKGTCDGTKCVVDCSNQLMPCTGELCANALPCEVNCNKLGACKSFSTTTRDQPVTIHCNEGYSCQGGINCMAAGSGSCDLECTHDYACDSNMPVNLQADKGTINCDGNNSCRLAKITCVAQTSCSLSCDPNGGPMAACNPDTKAVCTSASCMGFPK